jgi:hypothetical protein
LNYDGLSAMGLLEHLWNDYGRQVAVDAGGELQIVARTFPAVPPALRQAIAAKERDVRTLLAMERKSVADLVT